MVFIKKFFAIISGNIAVVISSFIIAAVLVRDYGLEDYGKFVVMQSLFMVFPIITRPLVWQAVVKFKNEIKSQDAYNHSLKLEIMSFALISVAILLCFKLLLVLFPGSTYFIFQSPELFAATLLLSLPYNSGAVVGYYRSKEKYKHLSSVLTFSSMVKLMVVLFVHKDITNMIIYLCAVDSIVWLVIVCFTFYKLNREKTESSLNFKIKKQFLNYSFWGNTHAFLDLPVSHLDRIIISAVFSVELVGVFNLVKRIGGIVKQLADPILQILFPKFIDCLKCGNVNQIKIVISQLRRVSFLLAFLTLFVGAFGYEIIEKAMFAGEMADYKYEILAFSIVQVYAFSYIWIHPLCISLSAMREVTIITLVSNVIYLVMLVIGVNYLDMYGVVLATLIQYAIVIQLKKNIIRDKFIDW